MGLHQYSHPLANQEVTLKSKYFKDGCIFRIEDWWDKVHHKRWHFVDGNPACSEYFDRVLELGPGSAHVLEIDEVVYGKINGLGYLVHVSELGELVPSGKVVRDDV